MPVPKPTDEYMDLTQYVLITWKERTFKQKLFFWKKYIKSPWTENGSPSILQQTTRRR